MPELRPGETGMGDSRIVYGKDGIAGSRTSADRVLRALALLLLCLFLVRTVVHRTTYRGALPGWFSAGNLQIAAAVLVLLRLVLTDLRRRYTVRQWLAIAAAEAGLLLCYAFTRYDFALDTALFMLLFAGISMYDAAKVYALTAGSIYLAALLGAMSGSVRDLVYHRWVGIDVHIRHSLGVVYPTDCAAAWFYLILAVWIAVRWLPPLVTALLMAGGAVAAYRLCDARNSTVCLFAGVLGVLYYILSERSVRKNGQRNRLVRALDALMTAAFPLFAALTISLALFGQKLDAFFRSRGVSATSTLSSVLTRMRVADEAFRTYGFSLFGKAFRMIGAGSTTFYNGSKPGYNFIDCAYCMIFIRYGAVTLAVFTVLYIVLCRRAVREGQRKLLIVLALIALHNVTEHHYTEICYNFTLLLPLAALAPAGTRAAALPDAEQEEAAKRERKAHLLLLLYIAGICALCVLCLPRALSVARTLVTMGNFAAKKRRLLYLAGSLGILTALTAFFAFAWQLMRSRKRMWRDLAGLALAALVLIAGAAWARTVLVRKTPVFAKTVEAAAPVMELLEEGARNGRYRIFVDDLPELYRKRYGKEVIADHFFMGDGLCEEKDAVVITKRENELTVLIRCGFRYAELSDQEGLYTNSQEVTDLLGQAGITASAAYTTRSLVNLQRLAALHSLETTEDGGILIDGDSSGADEAMTGKGADIYQGTLSADYEISLVRTTAQSGPVGEVRIRTGRTGEVLASLELTKESFDESGRCTVNLQVPLSGDTEKVEFPVIPYPGTVLEVRQVSYGKI